MYESLIIFLTLFSGLLIIYHHIAYPLILRKIKRLTNKKSLEVIVRKYATTEDDSDLPTISIIIPAYNEERWIADKIRNLSIIDYPSEKLNIIIGCDGCDDKTAKIARQASEEIECQSLNIDIRNFPVNRGKVAVINELVLEVKSDLVSLSDVSALLSVDALLIAAQRFKEPELGVLTGHYRLLNPGSTGEEAYWKYQSHIKSSEAALGSTLGAHGAFYLFRRQLFSPLPKDTINDDFILPMKIVAAGYKSGYEESIMALEQEQASNGMDHQRRRRIAAGNMQQLFRLKTLLLPIHGGVAFAFISGKGLRVLMPFLMMTALVGSILLASNYLLFLALSVIQLFLYSLAVYQIVFQPKKGSKIMKTLAYLVSGYTAGLIGTLRYLAGLERGRWKRVDSIKTQSKT